MKTKRAKMCKHWDDQNLTEEKQAKWNSKGIRQTQCEVCKRWFWPHEWAKKIIAPKKRKTVRVRAWAYINDFGGIETVSTAKVLGRKPVTILIDRKYIGGKK